MVTSAPGPSTGDATGAGHGNHLLHWLRRRNPRYIARRAGAIVERYGLTSRKGTRRASDCVEFLGAYGCRPSFMVPGRVMARHPAFFRSLQDDGAELALHGYDHVDFTSLTDDETRDQFTRSAEAFTAAGVRFSGFRCPYLSYTDRIPAALPPGLVSYSSNRAVSWAADGAAAGAADGDGTPVFSALEEFYSARPSATHVAVPRAAEGLIEIPAAIPDDIQLYDGLGLGTDGLTEHWTGMLRRIHARGEVFVILFHPELFAECRPAFADVLEVARGLRPAPWVVPLAEVATWWREKADFAVHVRDGEDGIDVEFHCSERATVLVRGLDGATAESTPWHGAYRRLHGSRLHVDGPTRPFVGLGPAVSSATRLFLVEQGYIVEGGAAAAACGVRIERDAPDQVHLIEQIESSPAPLVRYWRWPDGARSTLCVTGDLDALSLVDYGSRLFTL